MHRTHPAWIVALLGLVVLAAGCRGSARSSAPSPAPSAGPPGPITAVTPGSADRSGPPLLPDRRLTPGATLSVGNSDICVPGYTRLVRDVPSSVKKQVYEEYGITSHAPGDYEVDHLISLELGGSNSIRNLWPQSYRTEPWNARVKDALENELHQRVCSGQLDLKMAQQEIAGDWIAAYKKYFHTDRPLSQGNHGRRPSTPEMAPAETSPGLPAPPAPAAGREPAGGGSGEVWVNTRSGKYFHPGSHYYGNTREGRYMSEQEALRYGYTAARGE